MSVKPDNNSTESKLTPHLDLDQVVVRDMISTDLTEVHRPLRLPPGQDCLLKNLLLDRIFVVSRQSRRS